MAFDPYVFPLHGNIKIFLIHLTEALANISEHLHSTCFCLWHCGNMAEKHTLLFFHRMLFFFLPEHQPWTSKVDSLLHNVCFFVLFCIFWFCLDWLKLSWLVTISVRLLEQTIEITASTGLDPFSHPPRGLGEGPRACTVAPWCQRPGALWSGCPTILGGLLHPWSKKTPPQLQVRRKRGMGHGPPLFLSNPT